MRANPQSIWKKPFKGPRGLLLWFLLLASATFLVLAVLGLVSSRNNSIKDVLVFALVGSFGIATAFAIPTILLRWAFNWRNLRRIFFGIVCLATLIALFYAEENWRGKRAWENYKQAQEAKGEQFDRKSLAPPAVPDDQNFAMAPLWVEEISGLMGADKAKQWYGDKVAALGHTNFVPPLEMPIELGGLGVAFTNKTAGWPNAEKFDLNSWQDYYRRLAAATNFFLTVEKAQIPAEEVLLALSRYDSNIEELRRASSRPYSRFPVGYGDDNPAMVLLPHLSSLKESTIMLQLRAVAALGAGQSENALQDILLMLRLTEAIRTEPFLICHLVRVAMLQIALQPVWEGLAGQDWSAAQLATLEAELAKLDFLADYQFAMQGERAFGIGVIDYLRRHRKEMENFIEPDRGDKTANGTNWGWGELVRSGLSHFLPGGWFEQSKIAVARMHQEYLLPIVLPETHEVSISAHKNATHAIERIRSSPHDIFSAVLIHALEKVPQKSARAHSSTDLARVAIALERYRLAQGAFPETLDVLAPQFLPKIPHDVINGGSLQFRRTADGQFILYSVGWNGTDDGGEIVLKTGSTPTVDINKGDWVWKYPAQ